MKTLVFALGLLFAAALFTALGLWQLERLAWKRDLIVQTERNLAAEPIMAPSGEVAHALDAGAAYTRVWVRGDYITGKDTFVVASTRYGRGYWVMTPLKTLEGFTVLVNRGFVTPVEREAVDHRAGVVELKGLLRLSEVGGSVLQRNQPEVDRWYSRDVAAIAARQGLEGVVPYFIDAEAGEAGIPVGGLTVVQFRNNHLQYALTWFALALLAVAGMVLLLKGNRRWRAC